MKFTLSELDRAVVEVHLRSSNKLKAILVVREAFGFGLKEAVDFLTEFEQQLDPPIEREDDDMGMAAYVLAIGSFRKELIEHMAYPTEYYANTAAGVPVVRILFECFNTSQSVELAACFGVEPWDFNQHKLDPNNLDLTRLHATFPEDEPQDEEAFFALRDAGFDFYYLPNG